MLPGFEPVRLPYLAAFGTSAVACLAVAGLLANRPDSPGERELGALFVAVGLWAVNSAARVVVTDPVVTRALLSAELVLGVVSATLWLLFAARYAGYDPADSRPVRALLGGYLALAVLLPVTNGLHGLVWTSLDPVVRQGVVVYAVGRGPGHYALTVLAYLMALIGLYYLVRLLWSTPPARPALGALLTGFSLLIGANLLPYVADMLVDHPPTVTPLGAAFGAIGGVIAVRYDLFGVVAVARRSVFRTLRDPVAVVDPDGRLLDTNDAFDDLFPVELGAPLADSCPDLAAGTDLCETTPQTVHLGDDPAAGHYSVTVSPVEVGSSLRGRSLVLRDVSDLTAATRQLRRQNEQLDEIAYSAAHNLRNPLGVIGGYADVLETHLDSEEERFDPRLARNCLEKIHSNSERMEEIINDLLRVTHASKASSDRAFVPVAAAAERALRDVDGGDHLSLAVEGDGAVRANPDQFEMLLQTLVRAARDRTDGTGEIRMSVTGDGFAFADTGTPIDAEDAEVFLSYGYTTKYPGTGLGLAVAQVLAASHDWTIVVDPDYDDGLRVVVSGATVRSVEEVTVADRSDPPRDAAPDI